MKSLLFSLFLITSSVLEINIGGISKALSAGDADALSKYFGESVEISILDSEEIYTKKEAVAALKDFFTKNKPKAFNAVHEGLSKGKDLQYSVGDLQTVSGNFRVYIYLKGAGENAIIQELRFDKP